jgi:hypothetical protein
VLIPMYTATQAADTVSTASPAYTSLAQPSLAQPASMQQVSVCLLEPCEAR